MPEDNLEPVRAANEAFARRDTEAILALVHPDVVWEERGNVLPGLDGTYRGPDGVMEWLKELLAPWETFEIETEQLIEGTDGRVFMEFFATAKGRASGAETELRGWQVLEVAEGKVTKRRRLWSREEALEAAGLPAEAAPA